MPSSPGVVARPVNWFLGPTRRICSDGAIRTKIPPLASLLLFLGQCAPQWRLRLIAQEAALKGVANSNLRILLAYNKSFMRTDVRVGYLALFYNLVNRKSAPRRRGLQTFRRLRMLGRQLSFRLNTSRCRVSACVRGRERRMRRKWQGARCRANRNP